MSIPVRVRLAAVHAIKPQLIPGLDRRTRLYEQLVKKSVCLWFDTSTPSVELPSFVTPRPGPQSDRCDCNFEVAAWRDAAPTDDACLLLAHVRW